MNPMNQNGHDDKTRTDETTDHTTAEKIDVKSNDVTPGSERATRRPAQPSQPAQPAQPARVSESAPARGPVTPDRTADPRESADARESAAEAARPAQAPHTPHTPREPGAPKATADDTDKLQRRLQQAVGGFVDEPRHAVEEADHVLEEATERLLQELKGRHHELRAGWNGGRDNAGSDTGGDTEKLRVALQGYRELVDRVLHI
ncbi:hypothetical protein ACFWVC_35885 [Streptomyces sp. NPDC058691]|uniref:hypothetical protein n=1 Tax=Streptomyces sp. NPDC058691 TaxID=3346601 RepID=UPI0036612334